MPSTLRTARRSSCRSSSSHECCTNMTSTFTPDPSPNTIRSTDGKIVTVPDGWVLILPGDPTLIRRVKAAGGSSR
jgi:hypothetical protein